MGKEGESMFGTFRNLLRSYLVLTLPAALIISAAACGGGGSGGGGDTPTVTVPTVLSTVPDDGATGVRPDSEVSIQFSEEMDAVSVFNNTTIDPNPSNVNYTWLSGSTLVRFSPAAGWADSTHYTITIGASAQDAQGTSMGSAYMFSFDTGDIPIATIISPAPGETNVGLSPVISISFSEPMDTGSVADNFGVSGYSGYLNLSWSGAGMASSLDVSFATSLTADTTYTATLLPFAEDQEGTSLGVPSSVTFSTGASLATGSVSGTIDDDPASAYDDDLEDTIVALFDHPFYYTDGPAPLITYCDSLGAYHFSYVAPGVYYLLALQDTNGDGETGGPDAILEAGDSLGIYDDITADPIESGFTSVVVTASAVTGIDFSLLDPEAIVGDVSYAGVDTTTASISDAYTGAFTSGDLTKDPLYGYQSRWDDSSQFDPDARIWHYAINAFFETGARMAFGNYYIGAYIDLNGNGDFDPDLDLDGDYEDGEPAGIFPGAVLINTIGQDAVNIDITAYDTITAFGAVQAITDTANLDGAPYEGATIGILGYPPLAATSGTDGMFYLPFTPLGFGESLALHAEPKSGSTLMPYNSQYGFATSADAYRPNSAPGKEGWSVMMVDPDVAEYIGSLACSVVVDTDLAFVAGNSNVLGGEVLFPTSNTVYYVDSQMNCSHSSLQDVSDGPNFFIFNVDEDDPLISGNRASVTASLSGPAVTVEIPVRNGEFTWVDLNE